MNMNLNQFNPVLILTTYFPDQVPEFVSTEKNLLILGNCLIKEKW